jgi:hypothetical protein
MNRSLEGCLIYLARLAAKLDIDPLGAVFEKMKKNAVKYQLAATDR